jgi:hypothetical protein
MGVGLLLQSVVSLMLKSPGFDVKESGYLSDEGTCSVLMSAWP